ncbi:MAG: LapA family protein [Lacunisphaera sp.]|nr:LapA family protein [Lacunisphaera sp.]
MKLKTILILVLMVLVAVFSVQNTAVITVRFFVWQFVLSQALVILLAAICGAVAGLAIGAWSRPRREPRPALAPTTPDTP